MNEQELAEIKARAEAATPGPWDIGHAAPPLYASNSCITAKLGENMAIIFEANHNFELDKSADFIAHARQDIPALLAEVERLTQYAADCNALLIIEAAKAKDAKAEVERLRENNERLKIALENEQSQFAKRNEENTRLRRVLMNIESAKRLHSGIPWEAMVMTLQDIARQGLKGG